MENFEKCAVAMLGGQCSQHVTGNTSRQNQPQSAIIAYPRWRRQRYRHSRRMHTRKFTYLARGPLLLNDTAIIFLNRESPDSIYIVTEWRQSIIRMTRTDSNDISATGLRDYIYYIYIECCTYIIYKCLLFYSNWSLCFVGIRHLMKLKYTMPHVPDFLRSVWLEISTDFFLSVWPSPLHETHENMELRHSLNTPTICAYVISHLCICFFATRNIKLCDEHTNTEISWCNKWNINDYNIHTTVSYHLTSDSDCHFRWLWECS